MRGIAGHVGGAARRAGRRGVRRAVRRAFTLVELLLVIAIVALLIGILLPALGQARETAWTTVCMSNLGSFGKAVNLYANDNKERVWGMFEWAPIQFQLGADPPRKGAGFLYQYVDDVYKINECPKNKRKSIQGTVNTTIDPQFGRELGVGFDYTFVSRVQGLRLGAPVRAAMLKNPRAYAAQAKPPVTVAQDQLTLLSGIPVFLEESGLYNNSGITDGLWGNWDQLTRRHQKRGNAAFVEGHVGTVAVPFATLDDRPGVPINAGDFDCNDVYVSGTDRWVRLEPTNVDNRWNGGERPFGWINNPR